MLVTSAYGSAAISDGLFTVLSPEDVDDLPPEERIRYLQKLVHYDAVHGTDLRAQYDRAAKQCTYRHPDTTRCMKQRLDYGTRCITHVDIDEIDPEAMLRSRATKAKLRLAETLEAAVDRVEEIIGDPDVPVAVALKAASEVFDRAGVPRLTASSITAEVEVTDSSEATRLLSARLDRLAETLAVSSSTPALNEEIVEGEVVDE